VPTGPEFDVLFKKDINMRIWHSKLEKQPRDAIWATEMEEALRRHFLVHPDFAGYGVNPEVHCRTSLCEVRMLAYGADKGANWADLRDKPGSQSAPWPAKAFAGVINWDERDGETAVYFNVAFRNRPDPNKDFPRGFSELP
jgi:hypothetical protein